MIIGIVILSEAKDLLSRIGDMPGTAGPSAAPQEDGI